MNDVAGKALITGCNGFVGKFLAEHLSSEGWSVAGIDRQPEGRSSIDYSMVDITDAQALSGMLRKTGADTVFHLAAIANPRTCDENPLEASRVNILGTLALLDAIKDSSKARFVCIGSSEQYQHKDGNCVVFSEADQTGPSRVYGITKDCAEQLGKQYARRFSIDAVFTRSFNHSGPGQLTDYVLSDFSKQCAAISLGLQVPFIEVGNIEIERDFLDVRDVVRAYRMLAEKGKSGETYNVASGRLVSFHHVLDYLVEKTGRRDVAVSIDPKRVRQGEPGSIRADIGKIASDTGWMPRLPIERTLDDLFDYWRANLSSQGK